MLSMTVALCLCPFEVNAWQHSAAAAAASRKRTALRVQDSSLGCRGRERNKVTLNLGPGWLRLYAIETLPF